MWNVLVREIRRRDVNGLALVLGSLVITVAATSLTEANLRVSGNADCGEARTIVESCVTRQRM